MQGALIGVQEESSVRLRRRSWTKIDRKRTQGDSPLSTVCEGTLVKDKKLFSGFLNLYCTCRTRITHFAVALRLDRPRLPAHPSYPNWFLSLDGPVAVCKKFKASLPQTPGGGEYASYHRVGMQLAPTRSGRRNLSSWC